MTADFFLPRNLVGPRTMSRARLVIDTRNGLYEHLMAIRQAGGDDVVADLAEKWLEVAETDRAAIEALLQETVRHRIGLDLE